MRVTQDIYRMEEREIVYASKSFLDKSAIAAFTFGTTFAEYSCSLFSFVAAELNTSKTPRTEGSLVCVE